MKLTRKEMKEQEKEFGYKCDICHKEVIYKFDTIQRSTVAYSIPSYGAGTGGQQRIDICSIECLLGALEQVCYSADIHLSSNFIDDAKKKLRENN